MKRKILYSLIVMLLALPALVKAQAPSPSPSPSTPLIYKDWKRVIETADHTEISTRVIRCNLMTPNQVHILLFNEAGVAKVVNFKVQITNKIDNKTFSKKITFNTAPYQMVFTDCSDNPVFSTFRIDLPNDYNPQNLDIVITML